MSEQNSLEMNFESEEKKKSKKPKNDLGNIQVLDYPNRTLPKLIEELIEKEFTIILSNNGYYIEGFYGLETNSKHKGFAFAQDTSESNTLVFYDTKGHKHLIKNFENLVEFNSTIWGSFIKFAEEYKKPNMKWFPYMFEYGYLNITPGK